MTFLLAGDYLNSPQQEASVTVVDVLDEEGKCHIKIIKESSLGFTPKWFSISLRGYHQAAEIPPEKTIDMSNAVIRWNGRLPENGAIFFYNSKEERDKFHLK